MTLLAFASAIAGAASCSTDSKVEPTPQPVVEDVIVKDGATHAALTNFVSAFPTPWDWGAPFDAPADGDVLHYPTTFAYHVDTSACSKDPGGDLGEAGAANEPEPISPSPDGTFTGEAYLLTFSAAPQGGANPGPPLLRVFTASARYTPTEAEWQKLAAASGQLSVSLSTGSFESDRLTTTCGPFLGQTILFTVQ